MNEEKRMELEQRIVSDYPNVAGIVVMKEGNTLFERYFNGCTDVSTIHLASVTKSIVSALIGIAIDQGKIKGIDQKILDFFPEYEVAPGEEKVGLITIKDMLTMTVPYKSEDEPYAAFFTSEDWVKFSLDFLGGKGRIGDFRYAPIIGPDILSGILTKVTGRSLLDFAEEYLFSPLGIPAKSKIMFQSAEEQLAFLHSTNSNGWVADPKGVNTAAWGLTLSPMDMAKIGQLYLDKGKWKGKQIIPEWWIAESTVEHSRWNAMNLGYGYLWWLIDDNEQSYAAMGDGGNIIYVNPTKKIVVTIASMFLPNAKDRIELIKEHIEPAL